jgi:hypothetical protein
MGSRGTDHMYIYTSNSVVSRHLGLLYVPDPVVLMAGHDGSFIVARRFRKNIDCRNAAWRIERRWRGSFGYVSIPIHGRRDWSGIVHVN